MSNVLPWRIILNRNWYQKGKFKTVTDQSDQQRRVHFAQGDAQVWREFISREIPRLYGLFMRHWPNPGLAEELLQKTVLDAIRGRAGYDLSRGSPEQWIWGIARNVVRLEIRKRAGRPGVDGDISSYVETIDTERLPDEILEQKETAVMVRAALNRLETKEQKVLKAKYVEGLSANQIARQMKISEKAVHSLLYRARNSLREQLAKLARSGSEGKVP
ncbi:MAG: RNA polymerase sigma factor [Planctomycetota bacterium]